MSTDHSALRKAGLATAGIAIPLLTAALLSGCNKEQDKVVVYQSVAQCVADGNKKADCETAMKEALRKQELAEKEYQTEQACEKAYPGMTCESKDQTAARTGAQIDNSGNDDFWLYYWGFMMLNSGPSNTTVNNNNTNVYSAPVYRNAKGNLVTDEGEELDPDDGDGSSASKNSYTVPPDSLDDDEEQDLPASQRSYTAPPDDDDEGNSALGTQENDDDGENASAPPSSEGDEEMSSPSEEEDDSGAGGAAAADDDDSYIVPQQPAQATVRLLLISAPVAPQIPYQALRAQKPALSGVIPLNLKEFKTYSIAC